MKNLLLITAIFIAASCNNSNSRSATATADSSSQSASKSPNTGTIVISNLDSLNYIYTSKQDEINKAFLGRDIELTGTIKNGKFVFYSDGKDGRKTGSSYGAETDLKPVELSNVIAAQPSIFFYDKVQKRVLDNTAIPNEYSPSELLNNIYSVFAPSSDNKDIDKGMGNSEPDLNEAKENYAKLKAKYPDVAKSLLAGEIVVVNFYTSGQPIADFVVIDEITIQGKLIDMQLNQLNKLWFKLAGTKIVKTSRTLNLDKIPAFVPGTLE